jgi:hypothetical protein
MDGHASPHHRGLTPPAPALIPAARVGKTRAVLNSSSQEGVPPPLPQRQRSVRFEGYGDDQLRLDGHGEELDGHGEEPPGGSPTPRARDSTRSSLSQRFSDQMDSLAAKLNGTAGTLTIVHRSNKKQKPSVPFVNTKIEDLTAENGEADNR